mmetsp:Transcript_56497/g.100630  ORF Transcript_56497/g.100630 Transcript_56497/m.100630 type:complete len:337 (+) Transcript_56497:3623-4633(+)
MPLAVLHGGGPDLVDAGGGIEPCIMVPYTGLPFLLGLLLEPQRLAAVLASPGPLDPAAGVPLLTGQLSRAEHIVSGPRPFDPLLHGQPLGRCTFPSSVATPDSLDVVHGGHLAAPACNMPPCLVLPEKQLDPHCGIVGQICSGPCNFVCQTLGTCALCPAAVNVTMPGRSDHAGGFLVPVKEPVGSPAAPHEAAPGPLDCCGVNIVKGLHAGLPFIDLPLPLLFQLLATAVASPHPLDDQGHVVQGRLQLRHQCRLNLLSVGLFPFSHLFCIQLTLQSSLLAGEHDTAVGLQPDRGIQHDLLVHVCLLSPLLLLMVELDLRTGSSTPPAPLDDSGP